MLPREFRMRSSEDFRTTTRQGVRVGRPTVVLHAALVAPDGSRRVGFVVGRPVGDAVTRNRVRRRLRHLVAAELPSSPEGLRVVVRALPRAATAPRDLPADFTDAWRRVLAKLAARPAAATG